jgi:putative MATE family efflux protein
MTSTEPGQVSKPEPALWSEVLRISWPANVEFMIITGIVFADIFFLARLGTEVLAGVGISVTVYRLFYEAFSAVALASTTVVAQATGAGKKDLARRGAGQSILLAVLLGIASAVLGLLISGWTMTMMGAAGVVKEAGVVYMRINLLAAPLYALTVTGGGVLKGVGDTRTPMLFTLVGSAFKILLTVGLVFGRWGLPELGVEGAALATLFGFGLSGSLVLAKLARGFDGIQLRLKSFALDKSLMKRVIILAWPVAAERIVMRMGFVFYMRVVSALGTVALAANQIALRLESVSLTVGFGFTIAATTLAGQAVGRRDIEGAVARTWATMKFSALTMGTMTVLLILLRHPAVGMFRPEPPVRDLATACLLIGAFELLAFAVVFTLAGALRGAGDTRSPMIVALVGTFGFRLPFVYLLGMHFGLGLRGIWYGTLLDWIGRAVLMYFMFRSGKWKHKAFITEQDIAERDTGESKGGLR